MVTAKWCSWPDCPASGKPLLSMKFTNRLLKKKVTSSKANSTSSIAISRFVPSCKPSAVWWDNCWGNPMRRWSHGRLKFWQPWGKAGKFSSKWFQNLRRSSANSLPYRSYRAVRPKIALTCFSVNSCGCSRPQNILWLSFSMTCNGGIRHPWTSWNYWWKSRRGDIYWYWEPIEIMKYFRHIP